jgi:hypothetical protein
MAIISKLVLSAGCRVPSRMCGFGYVTTGRRMPCKSADRQLFAQSRERETDHQSSQYITDVEI